MNRSLGKGGFLMRTMIVIVIVTAALLGGWAIAASGATREQRHARDPVRTVAFWGQQWSGKPLAARVAAAPPELVSYLKEENELYEFPQRPEAVAPPPEVYAALKSILATLPPPVVRKAESALIGIFLVKNLGSSGFAESVTDAAGKEKFALIALDRDELMKRSANEWASWKENSVFKPDLNARVQVRVEIEERGGDTPENAVRYIILHELGHVLGLVSRAHFSWNTSDFSLSAYPFMQYSWLRKGPEGWESRFDQEFPERKKLRYYSFAQALLTPADIVPVYTKLKERTDFASLPAAASPWEDFAESFATYTHVVLAKRLWRVRVEVEGRPVMTLESLWERPGARAKKAFMERWFKNP